jgi:hypothetical protein
MRDLSESGLRESPCATKRRGSDIDLPGMHPASAPPAAAPAIISSIHVRILDSTG